METAAKRVLDVGQCDLDHPAICAVLVSWFGADVDRAHTTDQALAMLHKRAYDLVLVNRILHLDRSEGIALVRRMRSDPALSKVPVMLISNYAEAQQQAIEAGAAPGFGKDALHDPATEARLKPHLDSTAFA
jgi:CheY-like chemotaxis protein